MSTTTQPVEFEVVHTHTRAEAIADGTLVDVTQVAREAGFVFPVALSAAAWVDTVAWSEGNVALQDETGRLWDVLTMARLAATCTKSSRVPFEVLRIPNSARARGARRASLVLHIGPGDDLRPVLTVRLPHED